MRIEPGSAVLQELAAESRIGTSIDRFLEALIIESSSKDACIVDISLAGIRSGSGVGPL
jgi:hypothetical protein